MSEVYGARSLKRRRRSNAELACLDEAIVAAVEADYPVTLRGVYYRVVSAGAVEKTEAGYRAVGRRLLALRRDGSVPYGAITDGTRWVIRPRTHRDLDTMLADAAASYRRALWHDQSVEVHVFVEKDAISGVVDQITERWDVPLGVLRGYASESFCYVMAEVLTAARRPVYVYQLGDHDPSGLDAWRDFRDKVRRFTTNPDVIFTRLAVIEEQIQEWSLPTRPTKQSDCRAARFRGDSVEVDAIPAATLRQLVEDAIVQHIDRRALEVMMAAEEQERELLTEMASGGWSS